MDFLKITETYFQSLVSEISLVMVNNATNFIKI